MTPDAIRHRLRGTLDDVRLSRSEQRGLRRVLDDVDPDSATLAVFRSVAFDLARETLDPTNAREIVGWLEAVCKLLADTPPTSTVVPRVECWFSPDPNFGRRIAGFLERARESIDVCIYNLTHDVISGAILAAHLRGIRVRVLTDDETRHNRGSDVESLQRAGVDVRMDATDAYMHHKFALFDGETRRNAEIGGQESAGTLGDSHGANAIQARSASDGNVRWRKRGRCKTSPHRSPSLETMKGASVSRVPWGCVRLPDPRAPEALPCCTQVWTCLATSSCCVSSTRTVTSFTGRPSERPTPCSNGSRTCPASRSPSRRAPATGCSTNCCDGSRAASSSRTPASCTGSSAPGGRTTCSTPRSWPGCYTSAPCPRCTFRRSRSAPDARRSASAGGSCTADRDQEPDPQPAPHALRRASPETGPVDPRGTRLARPARVRAAAARPPAGPAAGPARPARGAVAARRVRTRPGRPGRRRRGSAAEHPRRRPPHAPRPGPLNEALVAHIDDPHRFPNAKAEGRSSAARAVGAYFGLVPSQDQSNRVNRPGHLTKEGSAVVRHLVTEAASCAYKGAGDPPLEDVRGVLRTDPPRRSEPQEDRHRRDRPRPRPRGVGHPEDRHLVEGGRCPDERGPAPPREPPLGLHEGRPLASPSPRPLGVGPRRRRREGARRQDTTTTSTTRHQPEHASTVEIESGNMVPPRRSAWRIATPFA